MGKIKVWTATLGLSALVSVIGCSKHTDTHSLTETSHSSSGYFETPFQDESQFIVETIISDLAEQIYFAKNHQLPDSKQFSVTATETGESTFNIPVYDLKIALADNQTLTSKLTVNGPIWSPIVYSNLTATLSKMVGLEPSKDEASSNTDLLSDLTDGAAVTIEIEDKKLSKALAQNFTSALLHEKAAVLIGAFALREHSGDFYEIRSPLCRLTTQLAMAQYLRGGEQMSINGRMADIMLSSLMNNQADAVKQIDTFQSTDDAAVNVWLRTLWAYNTCDYRPLARVKKPSLIERIAAFRAFAKSVDTDIGWNKLTDQDKQTVDFVRIANEQGYSVQTGHELLRLTLPLEIRELTDVWREARHQVLTTSELSKQLNTMPERCISRDGDNHAQVSVLGWGLWAGFLQRQLCHAIEQNYDFLENKWGVSDEAQKFSKKCDQTFGKLRLYSFVRLFNCADVKSYHSAIDDCLRETVEYPQLTPSECWNNICYTVNFAPRYLPNPNPHINEWHKHNPPSATAYDPLPRFNQPSLVERPDTKALVTHLHALAPYDRNIAYNYIRIVYDKHPTYEQCESAYKLVLPYATYAMACLAMTIEDQPDQYEQLMIKASEPDPARYYNLGDYFRERHMDAKATQYYEKGYELCPDRVNASSHACWLVENYLKAGAIQKARKVADEAGDVYSYSGLQAKAEFFELTGKYDEAFDWYSKIEERYDDAAATIGFCIRYEAKNHDGRFDQELKKQLSGTFPHGVEQVNITELKSPPTDGMKIDEDNKIVRDAGMRAGDIVVAVSGIRVHNIKQYMIGRAAVIGPDLDLVVWQGNRYREIKTRPPNLSFGGKFSDYSLN